MGQSNANSSRPSIWMRIAVGIAACLMFATWSVRADAEEPADEPLVGLVIQPARFELSGPRSRQQLLATGQLGGERWQDLSAEVEFASSDPGIVLVEDGVVRPIADGTAHITATAGTFTASADVIVKRMGEPHPISFKNETQAALTKAGCNMGACHGSPSGKAGFRLSLRAFDPVLDIATLRGEFYARRANVMNPAESLLLKKPLMQIAHGGGRRMSLGDDVHRILYQWIEEGQPIDGSDVPDLVRIEVLPDKRVLHDPASRQQLIVSGYFSDGSVRDLTALSVFSSSNESVGGVSDSGLVKKAARGETAVLARYLDKMATSHITFLEEVPGFVWNNPPENNFIDTLVFAKLKQLQILPSELCEDEEFLRRVFLDLAGRLPSAEETTAFLTDQTTHKRAKLIDGLLDSNDFASFWTLKWADVLRSNSSKIKSAGVHKFRHWIHAAVKNDKPLDEFARELLTARGSAFENPAASFWRASPDVQDATETTAQLFLGIRIQCAKCHNHPFERWTQDNYYGIAAAFTRVAHKQGTAAGDEVIYVKDSGEITQPRTGQVMKVHLLLQGDVDVPSNEDRREVFANWLTNPDNPFFGPSVVNRIWGHLFGMGIVDPVDDFRDSNPPSNADLLSELNRQFIEHGYSQKWLIRTIANSRVYQLSARGNEFNSQDDTYFSHMGTRLLTAEQLLDAICHVTGVEEEFPFTPSGTRATELAEPPEDNQFLKVFGQPQREMACECERSGESNLSQALQMINGPVIHDKLRNEAGRLAQMLKEGRDDADIVGALYLLGLCRQPSQTELDAAQSHIRASDDRRMALEDIAWAVLNSKEFLFQH